MIFSGEGDIIFSAEGDRMQNNKTMAEKVLPLDVRKMSNSVSFYTAPR